MGGEESSELYRQMRDMEAKHTEEMSSLMEQHLLEMQEAKQLHVREVEDLEARCVPGLEEGWGGRGGGRPQRPGAAKTA